MKKGKQMNFYLNGLKRSVLMKEGMNYMKQYKIGYTTGVFDLFHVGHLNILKRAKEQCETLIVGVSTDELVVAYKSKWQVIPFQERRKIEEGIKYVEKDILQINSDDIE